MARTLAAAQAELARIEAALSARDPAILSYRTPDGRNVQYDWKTLYERLAAVSAEVAALSAPAGTASRRVYCKPQGNAW